MIIPLMLTLWIPVTALLGYGAWLHIEGQRYLSNQRTLDRCLHELLERECTDLNAVEKTNARLDHFARTILALKASQEAAKAIPVPGLNAGVIASLEASIRSLQAAAWALFKLQLARNISLSIYLATKPLSCGIPKTPPLLSISPGTSPIAVKAEIPGPFRILSMNHFFTELDSYLDGRIVSFGQCSRAIGGAYQVSFKYLGRNLGTYAH